MRLARQLSLLVVIPTLIGAALPAQSPPWAASVDSFMHAEMAKGRVPGAQVAIVEAGRLVYTKGYGVADVESGRPVTDRTLFQIGSVTKTVTAAVVAQLGADGALDLDAPVSRYVTELAGRRVGSVTLRQLLSHSAGLADHTVPFGRSDDAALGEVFRSVTDTLIVWEPGRMFSYSNPSFSLAGYVAERAAKSPYVELAERMVLRRLKMPRATFRPMVAMTYDFSLGHGSAPGAGATVLRPTPGNSAEYPAGFLYSSAAELSRLEMALMAGGMLEGERVLGADAVRTMTTGYVRFPYASRHWLGLGLQVDTLAGERVWRKSGSVPGFASEIAMWPDRQLAIAILVNRQNDLPHRGNLSVARLVANVGTAIDPMFEVTAGRPATPGERAALVGRYQTAGGNVGEIVEGSAGLEWRVRQRVSPVELVGADRFRLRIPGEESLLGVVLRDSAGRVTWLHRGARAFMRVP